MSSTAVGGGVAEMLHLLVGYADEAHVDTHWVVIDADAEFFAITKRLHNRLHGASGDAGALGRDEDSHYSSTLEANAAALSQRTQPGDIVILHDPQTAGLASHLVRQGARVAWRCHIGADVPNAKTQEAWDFLLPHLDACQAFVFSRAAFVPKELSSADTWIIQPSIDPLSPKNRPMPRNRVTHLLIRMGLLAGELAVPGDVVLGGAGPFQPGGRAVVQVSRWDYLKDMLGVMEGFAEHVSGHNDARLALVGPSVDGVVDDPEGSQVLAECLTAWEALPGRVREHVRLVALPMDDIVTNALMVNAMQRHASIVVQKSLQEGFGLTVSEAMWKSRPVVASAVGGIIDQVPPNAGVLLDDPRDLDLFGRTVRSLLEQPEEMAALGRGGRQHVRDHFLSDRHLIDHARLVEHMSQQ
ncbi:MAG: glycosyltransferase [Acidimicrobiales bacterium]